MSIKKISGISTTVYVGGDKIIGRVDKDLYWRGSDEAGQASLHNTRWAAEAKVEHEYLAGREIVEA